MKMRNVVPVITPFDADLSLDLDSFSNHVTFLYKNNVRSFIVGGTTGESLALNNSERSSLVESIKQFADDVEVIGCIFAFDWLNIEKMLDAFQECDFLLVMPPMFIRPNLEDILEYYHFIMSKTAQKIILYNNPSRTGVDMSNAYEVLARFPQVIGVKETKFEQKTDLKLWCGEDTKAIDLVGNSCYGLISATANVLPRISNKIGSNLSSNELSLWNDCVNELNKYANPTGVKYLLQKMGIIRSNAMRFAIKTPKLLENLDLIAQRIST